MTSMTREQFASAVSAAISSVRHLYRQVDRLFIGLRDHLAEAPTSLVVMPDSVGRSGNNPKRLIMRSEFFALFRPPTTPDEEIDEEEDTGEGEEGDEDGSSKGSKQTPAEIRATDHLLAFRIVMFDPEEADTIEPRL